MTDDERRSYFKGIEPEPEELPELLRRLQSGDEYYYGGWGSPEEWEKIMRRREERMRKKLIKKIYKNMGIAYKKK